MGHVYIMRHGQTTCNQDGIIQGPRIDSALSELGCEQAERLGEAFAETDMDHVYVSPMLRTRQTAQAIARTGGQALEVVPEMYEMDFGDLCGRPVAEATSVLEELDEAWGMGFTDLPMPGGESPILALHRIRSMAQRLRATDGSVGIVAHGRINRVLLTSLLGLPLHEMRRFPQANAAITHVEVNGSVQLHRLNDVTHLL